MSNLIPVSVVVIPAIAAGTLCLVGICSTFADKRRIKTLLGAQAEWKAAAERNGADCKAVIRLLHTAEQNLSIFKKLSQHYAREAMNARALVNAKNFQFTKFIEAIWGAPALPRRFVDVVKYIEDLRAQLADALRTAAGLADVVKRHDVNAREGRKTADEMHARAVKWEKQAEVNATILMTCIENGWAILRNPNPSPVPNLAFGVFDTKNNMRSLGSGDSPENAVKSAELGFTCPEECKTADLHALLAAKPDWVTL